MIIFILAKAYGAPMLPPYLNLTKGQHVKRGVNFAYSGSTALDKSYFDKKGLDVPAAAYSLSTQLDWFHKLKPSLCKTKEGFYQISFNNVSKKIFVFFHITNNVVPFMTECDNYLKTALILVGEIGGNDINAIIPHKNVTEIRDFVPDIVQAISKMITVCCIKFILNFNSLIEHDLKYD